MIRCVFGSEARMPPAICLRIAVVREQRCELVELGTPPRGLRVDPVDGLDPKECRVLLAVPGAPDLSRDLVAPPQGEPPDLRERDVDVLVPREITRGPKESVAFRQDIQDAGPHGRFRQLLLALLALALASDLALAATILAGRPAVPELPAGPFHHR